MAGRLVGIFLVSLAAFVDLLGDEVAVLPLKAGSIPHAGSSGEFLLPGAFSTLSGVMLLGLGVWLILRGEERLRPFTLGCSITTLYLSSLLAPAVVGSAFPDGLSGFKVLVLIPAHLPGTLLFLPAWFANLFLIKGLFHLLGNEPVAARWPACGATGLGLSSLPIAFWANLAAGVAYPLWLMSILALLGSTFLLREAPPTALEKGKTEN